MKAIRYWSDKKLEKELIFARLAIDNDNPRTKAWLDKLEREAHRRNPEGLPFSLRRFA